MLHIRGYCVNIYVNMNNSLFSIVKLVEKNKCFFSDVSLQVCSWWKFLCNDMEPSKVVILFKQKKKDINYSAITSSLYFVEFITCSTRKLFLT